MQLSRREFLKVVGAGLGGVALEEGLRNFAVGSIWGFAVRPDLSATVIEEGRKALPTGFFGWRNRGSNQDGEPIVKAATLQPTNAPTLESTATSVPTFTPEPAPTAKPLTEKEKLLLNKRTVWKSSFPMNFQYLIDNKKDNGKIDIDSNPSDPGFIFYGIFDEIFYGVDGNLYGNAFVNTQDSVIIKLKTIRYYNGSRNVTINDDEISKLVLTGQRKDAIVFLSATNYGTKANAELKMRMAITGNEILTGDLGFLTASIQQ